MSGAINSAGCNVPSRLNGTVTPLGSGETWTGGWDLASRSHIFIMSLADVAGTLYIDFANPIIEESIIKQSTYPVNGYVCDANRPEVHTAAVGLRYYRLRYVNGADAQTTFSLATSEVNMGTPLSASLNQPLAIDSDAIVVRPTDAQDEISLGRRGGVTQFNKFAHRPDLDPADGQALIISDSTTNAPWLPTTASTFTITYTPATDGAGGGATGAVNLYFYYLDANGLDAIGVHTLGSSGTDVTTFSGLGINRCVVGNSGSADFNVSAITVTATTGGQVAAYLEPEGSTTQQAILYVPDNAKAVAKSLMINVIKLAGGSAPKVTVIGYVWNRSIATRFEVFRYSLDTSVENHLTFLDEANFPLNSSDVLYFTAETDTANTTIGNIRFSTNVYQNV